MTLAKCKRCGKLFNRVVDKDICPSCMEKEEEEFQKVKDFLKRYPEKKLEEISEETGVDKKVILDFLREGRLQLSEIQGEKEASLLTCERCGKPITTGRFCEDCKKKLASILSPDETKPSSRSPNFYFNEAIEKKKEED
ncbi:MAG: uncharacterized protein PWP57_993 [Candidatus Atribacteria bacterium]|nr:uncharacterized protein [Candidatus Atribacteria bacterium]